MAGTHHHHHHHHHHHKRKPTLTRAEKRSVVAKKTVVLLVLLVAVVIGFMIGDKVLEKLAPKADEPELAVEEGLIEIDGLLYRRRPETKTYLLIGEDSTGPKNGSQEEVKNGQSDFLMLLVVDKANKLFYRVPINRDTICDVRSLDDDGTYIATTPVQISFAHAKGDGREISCENTVWSVSQLLCGAVIDEYASFNLDTIRLLNHAVEGVTVTIEDDLNSDELPVGETVTLTDDQAVTFVRGRMSVADGTNINRMSRQNQYMTALMPVLKEKMAENESFVANLYKSLQDYMVTTISLGDISRLAKSYQTCEDGGISSISGETTVDKRGFKAFYPDEDSIRKIVKTLLYMPAY